MKNLTTITNTEKKFSTEQNCGTFLKINFLLVVFFLLACSFCNATTYTWTGTTNGHWYTSTNWSPGGIPGSGDNVTYATGTNGLVMDTAKTVTTFTINSGTLDAGGLTLTISSTATFTAGTINNGTVAVYSTGNCTFTATTFGAAVTASANSIYLNGSTFNSTLTAVKKGTANDNGKGGNTFHGAVTLIDSASGHLVLADSFPDTFNSTLTANGRSTGKIYLAHRAAGNVFGGTCTFNGAHIYCNEYGSATFNGNIVLNTASSDVTFGWVSGSCTLSTGYSISNGGTSITSGNIYFRNFTQSDSTITITLTSTGSVYFETGSVFRANLVISAGRLNLNGSRFYNTVSLTQAGGATSTTGSGGNYFAKRAIIVNNSSPATLTIGGTYADTFMATAYIQNIDRIMTINNAVFNDSAIFRNDYIGSTSDKYNVANTGTVYLNGHALVDDTIAGINFGAAGGSTILANGKKITTSPYFNAVMTLNNFTQTGSTSQSISMTGNTMKLVLNSGTTFNGKFSFTGQHIMLNGATFNDTLDIFRRLSNSTDNCSGGNTFNSVVVLKDSSGSAHHITLANSTADSYNGNVTFSEKISGTFIYPAYTQNSTFKGNIYTDGLTVVKFGENGGKVILAGTGNQTISKLSSSVPTFKKIQMNKPSGIFYLSFPLTLADSLILTSGVVTTDATNILIVPDNKGVSVGSDASYVHGPMKKIGNDPFTFALGDTALHNGAYHPLRISAPAADTCAYTARYYGNQQTLGSGIAGTMENLSTCEYWKLDRNTGNSSDTVTLGWNSSSCNVFQLSKMKIAYWNGSTWTDKGNGGTTGNTTVGTVKTSAAQSSFGYFTLADSICSTLAASTTFTGTGGSGVSNGTATVTASLGTPNYTYSWSPGGSTDMTATGLGTGTYTATVTDANGCSVTSATTVTVYSGNRIIRPEDPYPIRGLYVDKFVRWTGGFPNIDEPNTMLGRTAEEDSLLKFARDNNFKYLILYDLEKVFAHPTATLSGSGSRTYQQALCDFMVKAQTQYCIENIGAIISSNRYLDSISGYNNLLITDPYDFQSSQFVPDSPNPLDYVENTYTSADGEIALRSEMMKTVLRISDFNAVCNSKFDLITTEYEFWQQDSSAGCTILDSIVYKSRDTLIYHGIPITTSITLDNTLTYTLPYDSLEWDDVWRHYPDTLYFCRTNDQFWAYRLLLQDMVAAQSGSAHPILLDTYLGWFVNDAINDLLQTNIIDSVLDQVSIHTYHPNVNVLWGYFDDRDFLFAQNNIPNTIVHPIFSAESDFSGLPIDRGDTTLFETEKFFRTGYSANSNQHHNNDSIMPGAFYWFAQSDFRKTFTSTSATYLPNKLFKRPVTACAGSNVFFDYRGPYEGGISFVWDFGDGTPRDSAYNLAISAQDKNHVFNNAGTYIVKCTDYYPAPTDAGIGGCTPYTYQDTVTIIGASISGSPLTFCSGGSVTLTATTGGSTYQWKKDATNISGATTNVYSATQSGVYSVVVTGLAGCATSTAAVTVTVNSLPTVDAGSNVSICIGGSTGLNATGANTYVWSPTTALSCSNCANPTANPTSTITYTVTGTDANGCINTDQVTVTVNSLPSVSAGTDSTICTNGSTTLNATGATTYSWNPTTALSNASIANPVSTTTTTITYTVTGTTTGNGCVNTDAVTITFNASCCGSTANNIIASATRIADGTYSGTKNLNYNATIGNGSSSSTVTFDGLDLTIGAGISITVTDNATLIIEGGSHLHSCGDMWAGIIVQSGGTVTISDGSIIEDAETAVSASDATVIVNGSTGVVNFKRNYKGIVMAGTSDSLNVDSVLFDCTTTLNAPHTGTYSNTHIQLSGGDTIYLSKNTHLNTFKDAQFGITANTVQLSIKKALFVRGNAPLSGSVAISDTGSTSATYDLKVGLDTDTAKDVKIYGYETGIYSTLTRDSIRYNKIIDCVDGIRIESVFNKRSAISNNFFTGCVNSGITCSAIQASLQFFAIIDNKINSGSYISADFDTVGIEVFGGLYNASKLLINGNEISNVQYGIHLNGIFPYYDIETNNISFPMSATDIRNNVNPHYYGILSENSTGGRISENDISFNTTPGSNLNDTLIGIGINSSASMQVTKNTVTSMGTGFEANSIATSYLTCNQFSDCYTSLYFNNSGNVGPQGTTGEPGDNTFSRHGSWKFNGAGIRSDWFYRSAFDSTNSYSPRPDNNLVNHNPGETGENLCDDEVTNTSSGTIASSARFALIDTSKYTIKADENTYIVKSALYNLLKNDTMLMHTDNAATDVPLAAFFNKYKSTNLDSFAVVRLQIDSMHWSTAASVNSAIVPHGEMETNNQAVNAIYLAAVTNDTLHLDATQRADLATIAAKHPVIGGEAVFRARSLLELRVHDTTYTCAVPTSLPTTIYFPNAACSGSTVLFTTATTGASSYSWLAPDGVTIDTVGIGLTAYLTFPADYEGGDVCVASNNSCGRSEWNCKSIPQGFPQIPASISGLGSGVICGQSGVSYTATLGGTGVGTPTFNWTVGSPASLASGQGSSVCSIDFPSNYTSSDICVSATNTCGTSDEYCITRYGAPPKPTSITNNNSTPCLDNPVVIYTVVGGAGSNTFVWTIPSNAYLINYPTPNHSQVRVQWIDYGSGNVTVKGTNTCGNSDTTAYYVSVACRIAATEQIFGDVQVYPNPTNGNVTFTYQLKSEKGMLQLCNAIGQVVSTYILNGKEATYECDLNGLESGIYEYRILDDVGLNGRGKLVLIK